MAYLIKTTEVYRCANEKEANALIQKAKASSDYTVTKNSSEIRTLKAKGEIVDESASCGDIAAIGKPTISGKIVMEKSEREMLGHLAEEGLLSRGEIGSLKETIARKDRWIDSLERKVNRLEEELSKARETIDRLREQYNTLLNQVQPYLEALRRFPAEVKHFISSLLPPKQAEQEHELPPPAIERKRSLDMEL